MDHFKGTTFFPKPVKNPLTDFSKQQQCINSGLPVFARDVTNDGKKSYFSCGYEYFCFNFYAAPTANRHVYELLQFEKPSKIYLDFDCGNIEEKTNFDNEVELFCSKVKEVTSMNENVPMYILDACTDKKLSKHVVFEYFLENIPQVHQLVEYVQSKVQSNFVDMGVYSRNRLFRILYSYKLSKNSNSALKLLDGEVGYSAHDVFKTLIQGLIPEHYVDCPFLNVETQLSRNISYLNLKVTNSSVRKSGYNGSNSFYLPRMFDQFIVSYGGFLLSVRENDLFISCIVGGKRCPWSNKVHKNNNQFFTICKQSLKGFFQCSDPECQKIQYEHVDLSYLWKVEFM